MEDKTKDSDLSSRKQDHIALAFKADMAHLGQDDRFYYEPMLSGHPGEVNLSLSFLGKKINAPIWVSSMTGGTEKAQTINHRLATACAKFGLGMGLGSCRALLTSQARLADFNIRPIIGPDLPFYANLGIAQVEQLLRDKEADRIQKLIDLLKADGLIVHVNPLQEWLQPEGDRISRPPIEIIQQLVSTVTFPVIVKEVGQGMGPGSINALLQLPIAAFELAAHGGTNFAKLELLRSDERARDTNESLSHVGHTAFEMVTWITDMIHSGKTTIKCREFILSGGIKDFLDCYYLIRKMQQPSVYGMASQFLKYATESQEALDAFVTAQIKGLQLAQAYLQVK
ncbi:MAG TPA: hypothetical protein VJ508_01240 [Saprospiraceae bacterium]|nr:hypothetical protein [Saprospiraceae bacterium]